MTKQLDTDYIAYRDCVSSFGTHRTQADYRKWRRKINILNRIGVEGSRYWGTGKDTPDRRRLFAMWLRGYPDDDWVRGEIELDHKAAVVHRVKKPPPKPKPKRGPRLTPEEYAAHMQRQRAKRRYRNIL